MSAPCVVNSVEFARKGATLGGELAIKSMQRLADVLFDTSGAVTYSLEGLVSEDKPCLRLRLRGKLMVVCQHCLGAMPFAISTRRVFVLTSPGDETVDFADEGEDVEHIPADPRLDVLALIEDELILEMPIAPVHQPPDCAVSPGSPRSDATVPPFSKLAVLKQNKV